MSRRSDILAERLKAFNDEVVRFVENCSEEDWHKTCPWEQWSVGVAARHIGAGHFSAIGLAKVILETGRLPDLTMDEIVKMANQHAREHAGCSRAEVLDILKKQGRTTIDYISSLADEDLDKTAFFRVIEKDVSVQRYIENVILEAGGQHFNNMKEAIKV